MEKKRKRRKGRQRERKWRKPIKQTQTQNQHKTDKDRRRLMAQHGVMAVKRDREAREEVIALWKARVRPFRGAQVPEKEWTGWPI